MSGQRAYGDAVAHSLGLRDVPTLMTRTLRSGQVGINRLSIGADQVGMTPQIPPEDTFILASYLTKVGYHELWSRKRLFLKQGYQPNAIRIVNLCDEFSAYISCPHETLTFYIPREALNEFTDDAGGPRISHLSCAPGIVDPVVQNLVAALLPAFDRPREVSSFFIDHVALALCAHVSHAYGNFRPIGLPKKGGLAARQVERAEAYIVEHYNANISLSDVARECGLSRRHFSTAFRVSTGCTPHQWQLRYRVEQAKSLLLKTTASIAEIAAICGFADQSHLTRVFIKQAGVSPARWRRHRRD